MGTGHIEEIDVVYYWVNNSGVKSKHSQRMDQSVFIEDGKNIMVEKITGVCPKNIQWLFDGMPHLSEFEFHVPENSIAQMYKFQ